MLDCQRGRVQCLPLEVHPVFVFRAAIQFIAEARMPDRREMHAYLMHPAGLGSHSNQRSAEKFLRRRKTPHYREMTYRVAWHVRTDRHPFALDRMTSDRSL